MDTVLELRVLPMSESNSKSRRGPKGPRKNHIDRLRGRVAMRVLMCMLDVDTANGLAKALTPNWTTEVEQMERFARTCRRYVTGKVFPAQALTTVMASNGFNELIPTFDRCINSVAWGVLKDEDITRSEMLSALENSPSNIGSALFETTSNDQFFESHLREFDNSVAECMRPVF